MSTFSTHSQLCQLWEVTDLARDLGVSHGCAYNWQLRDDGRGYVPPWYWHRLVKAAKDRHQVTITCDQLAAMTEHRLKILEKETA